MAIELIDSDSKQPCWYVARDGIVTYSNNGYFCDGGILAPHLELADIYKNRQKVIEYLNSKVGKDGLVPIKDIASLLRLTEEFVLITLEDFGMEITEEHEGN